jgi:hypothetical protein
MKILQTIKKWELKYTQYSEYHYRIFINSRLTIDFWTTGKAYAPWSRQIKNVRDIEPALKKHFITDVVERKKQLKKRPLTPEKKAELRARGMAILRQVLIGR